MRIDLDKLVSEDPLFGRYMSAFMFEYVQRDINEFIFTIYKLYQKQVPPAKAAQLVRDDEEENFTA